MEEKLINIINYSKGVKNIYRKGRFIRIKLIDLISLNILLVNMKGLSLFINNRDLKLDIFKCCYKLFISERVKIEVFRKVENYSICIYIYMYVKKYYEGLVWWYSY